MKLALKTNVFAVFALAAVTVAPALRAFAADTTVINGYISDSKCGAGHGTSGPNPGCVAKCIAGGAKPVFVDDAKGEVWAIDDPDAVKNHYGHHVAATVTVDADKKVVHVAKVKMLADQGKKSDSMDMH